MESVMDPHIFELLVQGGSFAVLVFIVGWLFTRHIPRLEARQDKKDEQFISALNRQEDAHGEAFDKQQTYWNDRIGRLEDAIDRGTGPSRTNGRG